MRDSCKGCVHFRFLYNTGNEKSRCCHYLLDTGNQRECHSENCDKKKLQSKKKKESVSMIDGHIDNHVSPKGERTE